MNEMNDLLPSARKVLEEVLIGSRYIIGELAAERRCYGDPKIVSVLQNIDDILHALEDAVSYQGDSQHNTDKEENGGTAFCSDLTFAQVWRQAVSLAGSKWFGTYHPEGNSTKTTKESLAPRHDAVAADLGILSSGEAAFLAALYSFYNSRIGAGMLDRIDVRGLGDLSSRLDEHRRRIIADLFVSYAGW